MIYYIFNKTSGTYTQNREELIRYHSEILFKDSFDIKYTKQHLNHFVPDIEPNIIKSDDSIIAVGGDGTINLCLQFIHDNNLQEKVFLGFIPAGTGNNMVKISNLSKNIFKSLQIIKNKKIKELRYGTINNKKVFFNFSLGFTSYVLKNRKTSSLKGYAIDGIINYFNFKSKVVKISSDKNNINDDLFIAFFINTSHYLSFVKFLKENDSSENINVFYLSKGNKFINLIKLLPLLFGWKLFKTFTSTKLSVELSKDREIEVDGDIYETNEKILNINNKFKVNFISG